MLIAQCSRGYETLQAATGREGIEKAIAALPQIDSHVYENDPRQ